MSCAPVGSEGQRARAKRLGGGASWYSAPTFFEDMGQVLREYVGPTRGTVHLLRHGMIPL
jgi:hypothetical protein